MTHSLVYFLSAPSVCRVKIGFTADLPTRFMQLQSSCPVKLTIMGAIPGDSTQENQIHQQFWQWRNDFEWFTLTDSVRKGISEILAGSEAAIAPKRFDKMREWIRMQIADAYNTVEDHRLAMGDRSKKRYEGMVNEVLADEAAPNGPGSVASAASAVKVANCNTENFLVTKEKLDLTGVELGTLLPMKAVTPVMKPASKLPPPLPKRASR